MKFARVPPEEAVGALLAHTLRVDGAIFRKGRSLTGDDARALRLAGVDRVTALRLGGGDLDENSAAALLAAPLAGAGVRCGAPGNGRVKLYSESPGLVRVDERRVHEINALGESAALATLAPMTKVDARQVVATLKVVPLALEQEEAVALRRSLRPVLSVAAFRSVNAGLVQTRLAGTKTSLLDKTSAVTRSRVESLGGSLTAELRCPHDEAAVTEAVSRLLGSGIDLLLMIGASASVDRHDCVPRGIRGAGGELLRLGMPVDPGHLTLLARCGDLPILVAPGSARSSRHGGFDLLLQRLVAGVAVEAESITALGVGGLRKILHVASDAGSRARRPPAVAAIVLAAGCSRRMGSDNKLLAEVDGAPVLARVVREALASSASGVYVVTGFERARVEAALRGYPVRLVHNPRYLEGISTSISAGLAALSDETGGALICLGDMPAVSAGMLDRIIEVFDPRQGVAVCVPTCRGQRGNPVLWSRSLFERIRGIRGDAGARDLIDEHADGVREVPIDDAAILLDVDSPDSLTRLGARLADTGRGAPAP